MSLSPDAVNVELLPAAPATLTRPLALVNGRAYAAAWPLARHTIFTSWDGRSRQHVPLPTPDVRLRQDLFIIRDDGVAFGDGGDQPLAALDLSLDLHVIPAAHHLWPLDALQAYRAGHRPDPAPAFTRLADVFDHFMDFELSLAPQRPMAELMAVCVLSTWLADGFNDLPSLWITGEGACGKSRLLSLLAQLSYLGTPVLPGEISAALRDLVSYGAALAFDDAHQLFGRRTAGHEQHAFLLNGVRRGVSLPAKLATGDNGRGQRLRTLTAFGPRFFASAHKPPAALTHSAVVVPLVITGDLPRARLDPHSPTDWPHPPAQLLSDLWGLALSALPLMPAYDSSLPSHTHLQGRDLAPWRAPLAVARWLSENGVPGLFDRLLRIAEDYPATLRVPLLHDLPTLVVSAIMSRLTGLTAFSAHPESSNEIYWNISTDDVIESATRLLTSDAPFQSKELTPHRIGDLLGRLRLIKPHRQMHEGRYVRQYRVRLCDLRRWSAAYSLPLPPFFDAPPSREPE